MPPAWLCSQFKNYDTLIVVDTSIGYAELNERQKSPAEVPYRLHPDQHAVAAMPEPMRRELRDLGLL
jgi:hypothetical protein